MHYNDFSGGKVNLVPKGRSCFESFFDEIDSGVRSSRVSEQNSEEENVDCGEVYPSSVSF